MAITSVVWEGEDRAPSAWECPGLCDDACILFFDPRHERYSLSIGDRFRRLDPALRMADVVVFRGSGTAFAEAMRRDRILAHELTGRPSFILGSGLTGADRLRVEAVSLLGEGSANLPVTIETLRQAELQFALHRAGGIIYHPEYHYRLPSGDHADKFVRVGDAIRDHLDASRWAEWLLEYLTDKTVVIADTGTILSIPLLLRHEVFRRFGWTIHFETLAHYPQDLDEIARAMREARRASDTATRMLCIVSVNSSGRIVDWFSTLEPEAVIVTLCDASSAGQRVGQALMRLGIERWTPGSDGKCCVCDDRTLLDINWRTYELQVTKSAAVMRLSKKIASTSRSFWEVAQRTSAVRLHYTAEYPTSDGGARHFPVYIDIARLLEDTQFRREVVGKLRDCPHPDCILIPLHAGTYGLESLAREAFGSVRILNVKGCRLSDEDVRELRDAKHAMILDDALVSGVTLIRAKREYYSRVAHEGRSEGLLSAFVIVSRPDCMESKSTVERHYYNEGSKLRCAAHLYVPRESCCWCAEAEVLRELAKKLDQEDAREATRRVERLRGELQSPVLFWRDATVSRVVGSFFGSDLDEKTAFAAAACAAQQLKVELRQAEAPGKKTLVDMKQVVDSYFDPILLAAVLRTLPRRYLRDAAYDSQVASALDALPVTDACLAELGLAMANNKIPWVPKLVADIQERAKSDALFRPIRALLSGWRGG